MFKKAGWRGRRERRTEAYFLWYVEVLSDARTKPTAFFNILLRLAQWTAAQVRGSSLFHRRKRALLIRIIVPASPPIVG